MKRNLFLLVNPKSGTGRMKNALLDVVDILTAGGYTVTVHPTSQRGDATAAVKDLDASYETIVCCGGDGTLNEVITGVMQNKNNYKIGYIPSGTLNEWSSGLKISRNIKKAAKDILNGTTVALDIGKFNDSYFSYTASFGAFTEASYSAPQDIKNVLGQAAYFFEGIKSLGNIKPLHLRLETESEKIEGDFLFGAISNSMSVGGIIKYDNAAVEFNDGLFEIVLIENPVNIVEFNDVIDGIFKKDLSRKRIKQLKASKVTITKAKNINWTLDGEYMPPCAKITVENLNRAINFIIPKK